MPVSLVPAGSLTIPPEDIVTSILRPNHHAEGRPTPIDPDAKRWPQLDRYRILGVLGRGGMGVVYRALDVKLDRLVALKMIHDAGADEESLDRVRDEAESVARLRHTGVVQIYEVGEYDGRPFLVLEYVEGPNLAAYLSKGLPSAAEVAQLVRAIAEAVHHAHSQGVLHRDLKPANILLDMRGTAHPKVTDFGIAKRLDGSHNRTQTGVLIGTPQYMAPEQAIAGGPPLTAAVDVYALGAILYECLTGRPPFVAADPGILFAQLHNCEPVAPGRLRPGLPPDLATICLKCLEKEPRRRYASAGELAADLGRYLDGESIVARPANTGERILKWARRQPALASAVGVAFAAVLLLAVGAVQYTVRLRASLAETEEQRQRAEANFDRAFRAVDELLANVGGEELAKVPQTEALRRKLLLRSQEFFRDFLKERADDSTLCRQAGKAQRQLGDIHAILNEPAEAEAAYRAALEHFERLVADRPDEPEPRYLWADTRLVLGDFLFVKFSRTPDALALLQPAVAELAALTREWPAADRSQARAQYNLGRVLHRAGQQGLAEAAFRESLTLYDRLLADAPDDRELLLRRGGATLNHGMILVGSERDAEAEREFRAAREIFERLCKLDPTRADARALVGGTALQAAQWYFRAKRLDDAVAMGRSAAADYVRAIALAPAVPDHRLKESVTRITLSNALTSLQRHDESATELRRSVELLDGLCREFPKEPTYRRTVAAARTGWARLSDAAGRTVEAIAISREAAADYHAALAMSPRDETAFDELNQIESILADRLWASHRSEAIAILRGIDGRCGQRFAAVPDDDFAFTQRTRNAHELFGRLVQVDSAQALAFLTDRAAEATRHAIAKPDRLERQRCLAELTWALAQAHAAANRQEAALAALTTGLTASRHWVRLRPERQPITFACHFGLKRVQILDDLGRDDEAFLAAQSIANTVTANLETGQYNAIVAHLQCLRAGRRERPLSAVRRSTVAGLLHLKSLADAGHHSPDQTAQVTQLIAAWLSLELSPWIPPR